MNWVKPFKYSHLDYYTKQVYIEYIKELSKLCRGREWNDNFPEYLISRDSFIDGVDPDFYFVGSSFFL